jgi:ACS family glucarate transporter-like MFS transporter
MTDSPAARPTRVRWRILTLLFAVSVITYIDRLNISVTARQMMPALGLTELQMGQIFSAFVVGYALCQIPGGWLSDRWGPRRILTLAVTWWSIFTAITAIAPTLPLADRLGGVGTLALVRFLVGVGEAAALPTFNRAVANWLAPQERGLGIGLAIGGIGLGSAITPPLTAWIMVNLGWQTAFYLTAVIGFVIAAAWWLYATDRPAEHPHVNPAEVRWIAAQPVPSPAPLPTGPAAVPWASFARTPSIWWLVLSYTCLGYVAYVYMSWFYLYLVNVRGFGVLRGALFASGPFIAISLFCPLGGWATDRLASRFGVTLGRALTGAGGMVLSGCSILVGATADAPFLAVLMLSLGAGWLYFSVGAYWSTTTDLSSQHAGVLSGIMNTGANVGGSLSPAVTPWLAAQFGWSAALGAAALAAVTGGLMWLGIKAGDGLARATDKLRT